MQEGADATHLRELANKCRRLADCLADPQAIAALRKMAAEYEADASKKAQTHVARRSGIVTSHQPDR
jgi:hypothetical protein